LSGIAPVLVLSTSALSIIYSYRSKSNKCYFFWFSYYSKEKRKIIRDGFELEQFNQLLSNPKVIELAKKIEAVNPKKIEDTAINGSSSSNADVFEI
jgi:hypothetical protein